MKLSLAIKITLKDYFPKYRSIPYETFVCMINHNNSFISQIKFSNLSENNFIQHNVETINSNIIYNFHILDFYKRSLIGICHLCINFDKIKNLNINDTLTQEGISKLLIDSNTKRKFFDNITNMGDIFLTISTEIKILNKVLYDPNKGKNRLFSFNKENINRSNYNNINNLKCNELNLSRKSSKKKRVVKTLKNNYDSLNILDTICGKSESNTNTNIFEEKDFNTFYQCTCDKKNKSKNKTKVNLKNIIKYNNTNFSNSYAELMSPKSNYTNYSKRKDKDKKKNRISLNKRRVSILNLLEQKSDKSKLKQNFETNINDENSRINNGNLYDFGKTENCNFKKKDYSNCNTFNQIINEQKENINKQNFGETDFFKKKNKNKILINICGKNEISTERKLNSRKNLRFKGCYNINTEIIRNNFFKNDQIITLNNNNINNIFLQTEDIISTTQKLADNKKYFNKDLFKDLNIKNINKYQNTKLIEHIKRPFSPKLSFKSKFDEGIMLTETNDRGYLRKKERINKVIMSPNGNIIKDININYNNEKNQEKTYEDLRKKYLSLFDCYTLLMKKIRNNFSNNKELLKKLEVIKENYNNLNKCKTRITYLKNINEAKKIVNHTNTHYEEEKINSKMISIKLKENSIYKLIFGDMDQNTNTIKKINLFMSQKKDTLLNLIKNVIKYYGNISQIFNEENDKKIKLIELLNKYNIEEKNIINLNYINYMNKTKKLNDKIITEVDEDKENEDEFDDNIKNNNNLILDDDDLLLNNNNYSNISDEQNNIKEITISIPKLKKSNQNQVDDTNTENDLNYDENLNNLINKILIEQFPENYNTEYKFVNLEQNKYKFKDKIFFAYIKDNDVLLKEDNYEDNKYRLNEFYNKFCVENKNESQSNFIYTKKIRQKYIKIKSYDGKEISTDKKIRNENNTTMDTDFIQQSMISKGNEIVE